MGRDNAGPPVGDCHGVRGIGGGGNPKRTARGSRATGKASMKLVYLIGKQAGGGGQHFEIGRSISAAHGVSGYASAECGAIDAEYCRVYGICEPHRVALMVQAEAMHAALGDDPDGAVKIIRAALNATLDEIQTATEQARKADNA